MASEWRKPPSWAIGTGLLLMALGASAGASLVFQSQFYDFARQRVVIFTPGGSPASRALIFSLTRLMTATVLTP